MSEVPAAVSDPPQAHDRFVIRGHHLSYLTPLVPPMNNDPEKMAQRLRRDSISDRSGVTAETVDWSVITDHKAEHSQYWPTYAYDLIGETDMQGDEFEASLVRTFNKFRALADSSEVVLTAQGLDEICGACTFKQHCRVSPAMKEDAKYLDVFEDVLAYARTKDTALDDVATRLGNGDILTTAKAVRRVMTHFAIANLWYGSLYNDAIARREKYGNVFEGPDASDVERYYDSYGYEIS